MLQMLRFSYLTHASLLISSLFNLNQLYSTDTAPETIEIRREDQDAFAAIIKMFAITAEYQATHRSEVGVYSSTTNPAQILETRYCSSPIEHGITKTGLYITEDSQYVGSPFGIIRLYQWSRRKPQHFSDALKRQFKIGTALLQGKRDSISILDPSGIHHFKGNIHEILKVRDSEVPYLGFPPSGLADIFDEVSPLDIGTARQKWCKLTKDYAGPNVLLVAGWAEQSAASLVKLNAERAAYLRACGWHG